MKYTVRKGSGKAQLQLLSWPCDDDECPLVSLPSAGCSVEETREKAELGSGGCGVAATTFLLKQLWLHFVFSKEKSCMRARGQLIHARAGALLCTAACLAQPSVLPPGHSRGLPGTTNSSLPRCC